MSSDHSNDEPRSSENECSVLFIVIDDTGFAQLGCYGSPINTPNLDKRAKNSPLADRCAVGRVQR